MVVSPFNPFTMIIAPIPANEDSRLKDLYYYELLDTAAESDFDELVELASQICKCPISLITLVDKDRQWFKSKTGLDDLSLAATTTHLDIIIGGHATNFCKSPMTTLNKNKEEVIINHAGTNRLALRKIEIGFDNRGRKNQLAFTRTSLPA